MRFDSFSLGNPDLNYSVRGEAVFRRHRHYETSCLSPAHSIGYQGAALLANATYLQKTDYQPDFAIRRLCLLGRRILDRQRRCLNNPENGLFCLA